MSMLAKSSEGGSWGFKRRHAVIIVVLLVVIISGLYFFATTSDAYDEAEHFGRSNPDVVEKIGPIAAIKFKFLDGFNITYAGSGGDASFVLGLTGQRGEAVLDVRLARAANTWHVEQAYLSTNGMKGLPLLSGNKGPESN
jgi:hypothetical protein